MGLRLRRGTTLHATRPSSRGHAHVAEPRCGESGATDWTGSSACFDRYSDTDVPASTAPGKGACEAGCDDALAEDALVRIQIRLVAAAGCGLEATAIEYRDVAAPVMDQA